MDTKDWIIDKRIKEKQQRIDKAISQREKSIAYFNSVNSAIAVVNHMFPKYDNDPTNYEFQISQWRDWFYSQWQEWYLDNSYTSAPPNTKPPTKEQIDAADKEGERIRQEGITDEEKHKLEQLPEE